MTQSIESSLAFLQIQKSQSNLKRSRAAGARTDDVFRIFRRTGQRIALIAQQIERERCTYLKNSYTEKNQLCKEFSSIFRSNGKHSASENYLLDDCLSDRNGRRERKKTEEIRRINVNVLKRCECCRRLALRVQENNEGEDVKDDNEGEENDCAKHKSKAEIKKSEADQENKKLEARQSGEEQPLIEPSANVEKTIKTKQSYVETVKVQFCCPPSRDTKAPAYPKSPSGTSTVSKKTVQEKWQYSLRRNTVSSLGTISLRSPSPAKSESPVSGPCRRGQGSRSTSLRRTGNSPWLKHSIYPAPVEPMDKVKLQGQAWQEHVQTLHSRSKEREGTPTAALPDAYEAFRKLVRAMEQKDKEKDKKLRREMESYPEAEWSNSRPLSTTSSTRWQPLKRTSVCHDASFFELPNFIRVGSRAAERELDNWNEESEGKISGDKQKDGDNFHERVPIFLTEPC